MTTTGHLDLVIIGAGPAGYVAAIRAAQLGMGVALVERQPTLGGTCLNIGCIPSKALLDVSERYHDAAHGFGAKGLHVDGVRFALDEVMAYKEAVIAELTGGVAGLMDAHGVEVVRGSGRVTGTHEVTVTMESGDERVISTQRILVATGSVPVELPFLPFDGERVVSSTQALAFDEVPERLVVIGAGAIGLELGSVWARFGAKVTVVELLPKILPLADGRVSTMLKGALSKQGIAFHLSTKVTGVEVGTSSAVVLAEDKRGKPLRIEGDKILVAVGRRPNAKGIGLEELGVAFDERGRITVDDAYRTSVPSVFAVGDVIEGPMLAHKGEEEGVAAVEKMAGKAGHVNVDVIPEVVYTFPEAASVGAREETLKEEGVPYASGVFPFKANGRALAMGAADGFVKVLAHAETDKVLGVHVLGPWASDLIAEAVAVMEFGGSAEDIGRTIHAHPTLSEALKEAALAVDGRAIHQAPPRRRR